MKRVLAYAVVTLTLVASGVLVSAQLDLTTFTPNTPILAEEVNSNFEAVADAIAAGALPDACSAGQIPEFDGSAWRCGVDDVGGGGGAGDITAVVAGAGLTGGGQSGDVALSVAFAGSGSAESAARSDHDHDDRYYTQSQIDERVPASDHLPIAGPAFVAEDGVVDRSVGVCYQNSVTTSAMRAAVQLPRGSTVTSVTFYFVDTDAAIDATFQVWRQDLTGQFGTLLGEDTTSGSGGPGSLTVTLATPETIDADEAVYLWFQPDSASTSISVCAGEVHFLRSGG